MRTTKYNPHLLDPGERARLFGGRQGDLDELLRVIRENARRRQNQHVVVVGPRGIGKTTLLLRVGDEVRADPSLSAAWFPLVAAEETYRAGSIGELWLEMVFNLFRTTGDARHERAYESLKAEHGDPTSAREDRRLATAALAYLLDFADQSGSRLLLVVENLQMLLGEQLSDQDGWALRETLIGEPRVMLLGSAVPRFKEIESPGAALFEQLLVHTLEPLDTGGCLDLWERLTGERPSRSRMRALEILTGGNPRLLVILAEFAGRLSLRELTRDLAQLVDDHTDYLKMTTEALPALERKVFVTLAEIWEYASAAAVAAQARVAVNTASAQLGRLEERGAVASRRLGRGKQYRVAQRLYSIYHLMRRRGGSAARARAVAEFMVAYYDRQELLTQVRSIADEALALPAADRGDHLWVLSSLLDSRATSREHLDIAAYLPADLAALADAPEPLKLRLRRAGRSTQVPAPEPGVWPPELAELVQSAQRAGKEGRVEDEVDALRQVVESADTLDPSRCEAIQPKLAELLDRLSLRQAKLGQRAEALASATRAVAIREQLAAADPAAFLPDLAGSLNNLSICQSEAGQRAEAFASIARAVELYEQLANADPTAFLPDLAPSLNGLSIRQAEQGQRGEALASVTRAVEIYEQLVTTDPARFLPDLAASLTNLAVREFEQGQRAEALASVTRAVEIHQQLAATNPARFLPDLAPWLSYLSVCQAEQGQRAEALASVTRAVEIYEKVVTTDPVRFLPDLAKSLNYLSIRQFEQGQRTEALASVTRAVETYEQLAALSPVVIARPLASSLLLQGVLLMDLVRLPEAEEALSASLRADPAWVSPLLLLGRLRVKCGRADEALGPLGSIVASVEKREERVKGTIDLAVALAAAGRAQRALEVLGASPLAPYLEPLLVALRKEVGEEVSAPVEVEEIAEDLRQQIRDAARQQAAAPPTTGREV